MHFLPRTFTAAAAILAATVMSACASDLTLPSDSAAESPGSPSSSPSSGPAGGPSSGPVAGPTVEFRMRVTSVDLAARALTLASGTVVRVTSATTIDTRGDLFTLESTGDAVAAGRPVRAEGIGRVQSEGLPPVIAAASLKIEVDD